ncbi:MAG: hypothetical protein KU37_11340 [Sulfuricurvum sp. PC08-66]|nr:MAG: hypothetical protein KU37_11340 [Sulfuricurvum sp. PC08-66]
MATAQIVLGGGCFWCIEAVYSQTIGVISAYSGYAGGAAFQANYEAVCTGVTGHAEVVQITYDEEQIDLEELLEIFWVIHDPTSLNAQGADRGTQYRSVIYYEDEETHKRIQASIAKAQSHFSKPIVTEVSKLEKFFMAEGYHQNYFAKNPLQGYCRMVVAPKVDKFKKYFSDRVR